MNRTEFVESVVAGQLKAEDQLSDMAIGDTVDVHYLIVEGDKERVQVFQGVLIGVKGRGINRTITVRRIVANEGVERIFPLHSPRIAKIEVVRRGDARRAKLYYLRDRIGKSRRLRDRRRGLKWVGEGQGLSRSHAGLAAKILRVRVGALAADLPRGSQVPPPPRALLPSRRRRRGGRARGGGVSRGLRRHQGGDRADRA